MPTPICNQIAPHLFSLILQQITTLQASPSLEAVYHIAFALDCQLMATIGRPITFGCYNSTQPWTAIHGPSGPVPQPPLPILNLNLGVDTLSQISPNTDRLSPRQLTLLSEITAAAITLDALQSRNWAPFHLHFSNMTLPASGPISLTHAITSQNPNQEVLLDIAQNHLMHLNACQATYSGTFALNISPSA